MNQVFSFETAQRVQCKASILIEGLTGTGKSGLALTLGKALAGDFKNVCVIDTENRSIPLFVGLKNTLGDTFKDFKTANFTPDIGYKPTNYLAYREAALELGAKVCINDSITHAWSYQGGVLDLLNDAKKKNSRYQKDSYAAWSDDTVAKEKLELFSLLRDSRCHIISTVRVKEKMEYSTDASGKTVLISLGEQEIMQADIKYEPDLVLHMIQPGHVSTNGVVTHPQAKVIKSRYAILEREQIYDFTPELCEQIRVYLEEGASPEELLEQQRQDYIKAMNEYLDAHKNIIPIWKVLKDDAGLKDTKLADMQLDALKQLYIKLTLE